MKTQCPRSWEVEAVRDGRVTGEAQTLFESHVAGCDSCAKEVSALDELARGLADVGKVVANDVALRRLRNRVLDAVDAQQTGRSRDLSWRRHTAAAALAAVALVLLAVISSRSVRGRAPIARPSIVLATAIEVAADAGTRYTRRTDGSIERFELLEGTLHLRVRRPEGGLRVLVMVPDGEIEDVGTVFDVVVAHGQTERVVVTEGRVLVRLQRTQTVSLDAGQSWERGAAAPEAPTAAGPEPVSSARPAVSPRVKPAPAPREDASRELEDAAYLAVLRLMREGRDAEASAAAAKYLREFPSGFRREEMARVASPPRAPRQ